MLLLHIKIDYVQMLFYFFILITVAFLLRKHKDTCIQVFAEIGNI